MRIYYEFGVAHPMLRLCPLCITKDINVSIQAPTKSSTSSDNNSTGVSSCSENNSSILTLAVWDYLSSMDQL